STRCTPFGYFASCSTLELADKHKLMVSDNIKESYRIDMLCLYNLAQILQSDNEILKKLHYRTNDTLLSVGKRYHYITRSYTPQGVQFQISSVKRTPIIRDVLKQCQRKISFEDLKQNITSIYEINESALTDYLLSLIKNQLLISNIDPTVTDENYQALLMSHLPNGETKTRLKQIETCLNELKVNRDYEDNTKTIQEIKALLRYCGVGNTNDKFIVQLDSFRELSQGRLNKDTLIPQLQDTIDFMLRFCSAGESMDMADFKKRFSARYELQEVPLIEALDPEVGVGYYVKSSIVNNPLIAGIQPPISQKSYSSMPITPLSKILLRKLVASSGKGVVELEKEDFKIEPQPITKLPLTIAAMFSIVGIDDMSGEYKLQGLHFSGSSAANLLGRFASGDKNTHGIVKQVADCEQEAIKDKIVAEIAHVPEARTGNILSRPHLRSHEITYLTNSTLDDDHVIPVNDLMLSISNNRVILRSKLFNKEIIPRLTTAHNFSKGTPIYRFLCELQNQDSIPALSFHWCGLDKIFDHLPRVIYRNIILSPERWTLNTKDIKKDKMHYSTEKLMAWKDINKLPNRVLLVAGDNKLIVDFKSTLSINAFLSEIAHSQTVTLEEFIECENVVTDEHGGSYQNEFIVPIIRHQL
ncbi:MAG: lantibiotic dehydratase family protein, partial [Muribaculaceae bacterium]|nr:lantibiotic dehydratase family protein [Muribaculaceae bacterium]